MSESEEFRASVMRSVEPIMRLSQVCGVTYLNRKSRSGCRRRVIAAYRCLVLSLLLLCLVHEIPTIRFWLDKNKKLHAVLTALETSLRWLALLVNSVANIGNNSRVEDIVRDLALLRLTFDEGSRRRVLRFQFLQFAFNVLVLALYMVLGHHYVWQNVNRKWYTSIIYMATEFYIAFGNVQFVSFLFVLRECYKKLNGKLRDAKKRIEWSDPEDVVQLVRECRESHLTLFSVAVKLNKCYSLQVLLFVLLSMIEIMYSLTSVVIGYATSDLWLRTPLLAFCHMFAWSGYYVSHLFQIVGFCDFTASESKKSSLIVHELINRYPTPEVERELELFSVQIIKNDARFTACGFFALSFPLLHSIAAAVTAYIIAFVGLRDQL